MKKDTKPNIISWIALVVSACAFFWSIGWSIYTFNKLMPLQEAKVVISESDIQITQNIKDEKLIDLIETSINNIGNSPAKNVRLRTYAIPVEPPSLSITQIEKIPQHVNPLFNTEMIHEIPPHTSAQYGYEWVDHTMENGTNILNSSIALVYHLEYTDTLNDKTYHQISFFIYTVGQSDVKSIVKEDFDKLSDTLKKEIDDDPYLLDYIKNRF